MQIHMNLFMTLGEKANCMNILLFVQKLFEILKCSGGQNFYKHKFNIINKLLKQLFSEYFRDKSPSHLSLTTILISIK